MLQNTEKFELQKILKLGDYKTYKSAFFDSQNYKTLRSTFLDNLPKAEITFPKIHFCSLNKVKQSGTEIVQKHTDGIDIKIPYTFQDELKSAVIETFGTTPQEDQINEIVDYADQKYQELCDKHNIYYVKVSDEIAKNKEYLPNPLDIHPSKKGYEVISKEIIEVINREMLN